MYLNLHMRGGPREMILEAREQQSKCLGATDVIKELHKKTRIGLSCDSLRFLRRKTSRYIPAMYK